MKSLPIELTTKDMIKKILDIVLADRRLKITEIADIVDMSTERIQNILHEKLESHDNFGALFGHV